MEKNRNLVCRGEEPTKASPTQKEAEDVGLHRETRAIWWGILKAAKDNENQEKSASEIKSQKW
jgi:hypothetical protein